MIYAQLQMFRKLKYKMLISKQIKSAYFIKFAYQNSFFIIVAIHPNVRIKFTKLIKIALTT